MRIGVISDTHGHVANTLAAVRLLEMLDVDQVLHCGDIGTSSIPKLLTRWPTHFVFGNCDHETDELEEAIAGAGLICHGRFGELELAGRRIAIIHSDDEKLFRSTIQSEQFDLVCYGHTHQAATHRTGRTLVLNPGALYRANPHTLAVVDLKSMESAIINL